MKRKKKLEEEIPRERIKRAIKFLLFRSHVKPGIRGWEIRRLLGRQYLRILEIARRELEELGLTIKVVFVDEERDFDRALLFVVMKEPPSFAEIRGTGLRIDELAALAVSVSYITSRGGRVPKRELEEALSLKLPKGRAGSVLDKLVRMGYLKEGEQGSLELGWRSRAEIDEKALMRLILTSRER